MKAYLALRVASLYLEKSSICNVTSAYQDFLTLWKGGGVAKMQ
jgi:hypothetical protein